VTTLSADGRETETGMPTFDLVTDLLMERHGTLFSLARLDEGDELYEEIRQRTLGPVEFASAAAVQIASLFNRARAAEAVTLGTDLLTRLGFPPARTTFRRRSAPAWTCSSAGPPRAHRLTNWIGLNPATRGS
jgi:hypothetical protein